MKFSFTLFIFLFFSICAWAESVEKDLTRDEVASIKKKLLTAKAALGNPPAGYAMTKEDYYLPTNENVSNEKMFPISSNFHLDFGSAAEKEGKNNQEKIAADYQKKYAEAMAKNDYEAMGKLSMEMQESMGKQMQVQVSGPKIPISVEVRFNGSCTETIDPDAVVVDQSGVIGLKKKMGDDNKSRVSLYVDPVTLKENKKVSKVVCSWPEGGITKKLALLSIVIDIEGPTEAVESWIKKIDQKALLGLIDKI